MARLFPVLAAVSVAVWFGGGLAVMLATRAIFASAETRKQAGHFSGAVLRAFQKLQVGASVAALLALAFGRFRWPLLFAVLATVGQLAVDFQVRALRDQLGGSTEGLAEGDPRRRRFGQLHAASVLLLALQILCAGYVLVAPGPAVRFDFGGGRVFERW